MGARPAVSTAASVGAFVAALALCAPPHAAAQEPREPRPLAERVNAAIDSGVAFLLATQREDGSWSYQGSHRTGASALAVYALLQCGVPPDDEAVVRGLERVGLDDTARTYDTACLLMALAAQDPDRNREWIDELATALVAWQNNAGDWGYPGGADMSNTQYAVLGLRAATYAGADVPVSVWQRVGELLLRPTPDGGYSYSGGPGSTASMTAAGVGSLAICDTMLSRAAALPAELFERFRARREEGLTWMDARVDSYMEVDTGPWPYYALYGVERVGALTGTTRLAGRDWYAEGAERLLARQAADGAWSGATVQTCFALLFLSRATSRPPKTGRGKTTSGARFATTGSDALVRLSATGEDPVTLWISGWGDELLAAWEWPGEAGLGPHVVRVVYLVDDRIVGEAEGDPEHPAEAQRFPLEYGFRAAGKYRLRARVHLVPPPADRLEPGQVPLAPGVFWSPRLEVEVEHVEPAWLVEQRGDHTPNLLLSAHPRMTATSYACGDEPWTDDRPRGDFPPSKAADGLLRTSWLADPADPLPRLTIALAKPREAHVILLSQARSAPYRPGVLARALTVEVTINERERHTVRMFADERRKGRLVLERPVSIRRLELAIPQKAPGAAYQCVGLAEVELRRGP